jgi:hypothetical protein
MTTLQITKALPPLSNDDDDDDIPAFPLHCLPPAAREMAQEIARVTTSQNESLAAAAVLGTLSAAIGAGIEIGTGGERITRGNLFLLAIAESGTGKGEAFGLAAKPFIEAATEAVEAFNAEVRPSLEADLRIASKRADTLSNIAAKEQDPMARQQLTNEFREAEMEKAAIQRKINAAPRWIVADVTKEKLVMVLEGQPGEAVASMSSEARGIFQIIRGRYASQGSDEDLYCSAYSGDGIQVERVNRPAVTLKRPCLSVCWMVQPDAARDAFGASSMVESGLLPRFLVFDADAEPQERFAPPTPISAEIKNGWSHLIRTLAGTYRNAAEPQTASVSPEASALMADFERENIRRRQREGDLRDMASFVARWTENAWRLMLVLHAAEHKASAHRQPVHGDTAADALTIARWFAAHQLQVLTAGRQKRQTDRLQSLLTVLSSAHNGVRLRDLERKHSFKREEVVQIANLFPSKIRIEKRKPEDKGRPYEVALAVSERSPEAAASQ